MALTQTKNPVVEDPISAAIQAVSTGKDPYAVVYGEGDAGQVEEEEVAQEESSQELAEPEAPAEAEESEESSNEQEVSPELVAEAEVESPGAKLATEEVFVKTPEGKRQAVKINYEDRDAIKKAYLKAAGFQVLNNKLAQTTGKYKTLEKEHSALKADMDRLEDIYQNKGVEALIQTLGKADELEKLVEARIKHREYLNNLSPEEKYRYDMKQQQEESSRKHSEVEAKYNKMLEEIKQKEESAATRSLESRLHPSFDRYRFAGKLGDEAAEHQLDETIWNQVTRKLGEYPDDVELTQAVVDREFRLAAQNLQKVIKMQTEKNVQKTVEKKKSEAAKTAQLTAKRGLSNSGEKEKFMQSIRGGDLVSAMAAMAEGRIKL